MRLTSLNHGGRETATVATPDGGFVPVAALAPELPDTSLGLLEMGLDEAVRDRLVEAAASAAPGDVVTADKAVPAPLLRRPRKVLGIGLNYREHAADLDATFPESPASFLKGDHTIVAPGEPIVIPGSSSRTTAEAELGIVIGRECRDVDEDRALDHVAGFCAVLDQTAEDILELNPRFLTRSKNFPTFLALGSTLVTTDEVLDRFGSLAAVRVATVLNGEIVRENAVANMAFGPEYLVSFHSRVMPLFPGDIISSGTPGAVVITPGDVAECRIDGVDGFSSPVEAQGRAG